MLQRLFNHDFLPISPTGCVVVRSATMPCSATSIHQRRSSYYGAFAFGCCILTGYASFLTDDRFYAPAGWVIVVFVLGALYAALGVGSGALDEVRRRKAGIYYLAQCAILTGIVWLSPTRGFMGIIVLPVVSQAIFDLRRRFAALVALYLFTVDIAVWGWPGMQSAAMSYATAFVFTIAFTFTTRRALDAREREATLRAEVEAANRQLREHAAQAEELATIRERNRLAREIHDGVGHYLTVVKTQLDAAAALLPDQPERARAAVLKASRLSAEALDDVRRSVGSLRTDAVRPPLPEALRALTRELGLPVEVSVAGAVRELPPAVEHALFRSAQEGLTNIRKHAAASTAEVALDFRSATRVQLAVLDNGRGQAGATNGGFGLKGIRERIELLGGRVETGNRHDGGFALRVELPA